MHPIYFDVEIANHHSSLALKVSSIFLISQQKHMGSHKKYIDKAHLRSNEYPQHIFSLRKKEKYFLDAPSYLEVCFM